MESTREEELSWGERSLRAMAIGLLFMFAFHFIENLHALINGWWTISSVGIGMTILLSFETVALWTIILGAFGAAVSFLRWTSVVSVLQIGVGFLFAILIRAALALFIVGYDPLWGWRGALTIAIGGGFSLIGLVLPKARSFAFGFTAAAGLTFLLFDSTQFPLIVGNVVFACVIPAVFFAVVLWNERVSKKAAIGVMVLTFVLGPLGGFLRTQTSAAHERNTQEAIGFSAYRFRNLLFDQQAPKPICVQNENPTVEFAEKPTRSVFVITVETLRADHATKEIFPFLFEDGWNEVTPFYSNATNTHDGLGTLFSGEILPTKARYLSQILSDAGYQTFASATFVDGYLKDDGKMLGFEDVLDLGFIKTVPEDAGTQLLPQILEKVQSSSEKPTFGWVHFYPPHFPYKNTYMEDVLKARELVATLLTAIEKHHPDAIIVFTGDHGESLGDFGFETHTWYAWESVVRVPLFLKGIEPKADVPRSLVDVTPTVLSALGGELNGFDGCDLASDCSGPVPLFASDPAWLWGGVDSGYKYIYDFRRESHRFTKIGAEEINLVDSEPDKFQAMRAKMEACENGTKEYPIINW